MRRQPRSSRYIFAGQHAPTTRPDRDDPDWRAVRRAVLERDGFQCQRCRRTVENTPHESDTQAHVDHVIPLARGGHATDLGNLQTLCRPCNRLKGKSMAGGGTFDRASLAPRIMVRPSMGADG